MKTVAIIPVKRFADAKSRLASVLPDDERALFALSMFEHVLSVCRATDSIDKIIIATNCIEIASGAQKIGLEVYTDSTNDYGKTVQEIAKKLIESDHHNLLILMSDLPKLEQSSIEQIISHLDHNELVLAPDLLFEGTNVLAMSPSIANRVALHFGKTNSFTQHLIESKFNNVDPFVYFREDTASDIDNPLDFQNLIGQ